MASRSVRIAVVVLMLVACLADGAAAQNTGTITARIVDGAGAVVPGADVVLTDERTGAARTAVSDPRGDVQFVAMPPGVYTVRVSLQGFRTLERVGNVLTASGQLALGDLTLALGNLSEVITVESTGTKVETDNSDYSALLTSKQIEQIQREKSQEVKKLLARQHQRLQQSKVARSSSSRRERTDGDTVLSADFSSGWPTKAF